MNRSKPPDELNPNPTPGAPEAAPQGGPAPEGGGGPQTPAVPPPAGAASKVITVPTKAIADIKRRERERARKSMQAELDKRAQALGYQSHDDMLAQVAAGGHGRAGKPAGAGKPADAPPAAGAGKPADAPPAVDELDGKPASPRAQKRLERERERALERARAANRARAAEEKRRRQAERQLEATQAEYALREAAVRAGVRDVDYALFLLRKEFDGKTEDELAAFDEQAYFDKELRDRAPYLYLTEVRGATTGPTDARGGDPKPGDPKPPAGGKGDARGDGGRIDARKLTPQEYADLLRSRGLQNPSFGMPA